MIEHRERLNERVTLRFAVHTSLTMSKHTSTLTAINSRGTLWERCLAKTSLQRGQASNSVAERTKAAKRSTVLAQQRKSSWLRAGKYAERLCEQADTRPSLQDGVRAKRVHSRKTKTTIIHRAIANRCADTPHTHPTTPHTAPPLVRPHSLQVGNIRIV